MSSIQPIVVPKWGMEMEEGTIQEWHVEEGAPIHKGDELVDIETSKIVNTLEANCTGVLRRRVAQSGVTLPVGSLLGVCAEQDVADADIEQFIKKYVDHLDEPAAQPGTVDVAAVPENAPNTDCDGVKASPSARKLAKELGLNLNTVSGTGPRGRISKDDVQSAFEQANQVQAEVKISPVAKRLANKLGVDITVIKPTGSRGRISKEDVEKAAVAQGQKTITAPSETATESTKSNSQDHILIPLTATRKTIAKRLVQAKQSIPHFYLNLSCDVANLMAFRRQLNESQAIKISVNDILVKAAALALQDVPVVNSHFSEEGIKQFNHSDIAIAVATEKGLLTPVIRAVESKGLADIARQARVLAERAHAGTLTMDDVSGGTFSISNLGMLGVESFSAVINPPQAAILAVGAINRVPGVVDDQMTIIEQLQISLSCDHRVIDGAGGARWLQRFKAYIEKPATMLL